MFPFHIICLMLYGCFSNKSSCLYASNNTDSYTKLIDRQAVKCTYTLNIRHDHIQTQQRRIHLHSIFNFVCYSTHQIYFPLCSAWRNKPFFTHCTLLNTRPSTSLLKHDTVHVKHYIWECLLSYEKCLKTFSDPMLILFPHFVIMFPGGKAEQVVMCARSKSAALSDCPPDSTQCSNDPSTPRHLQSSVPSLSLDEQSESNPSGAKSSVDRWPVSWRQWCRWGRGHRRSVSDTDGHTQLYLQVSLIHM